MARADGGGGCEPGALAGSRQREERHLMQTKTKTKTGHSDGCGGAATFFFVDFCVCILRIFSLIFFLL